MSLKTTFSDTPKDFAGIAHLAREAIKELQTGQVLNPEDTATAGLHSALQKYFPSTGEKLLLAKEPIDWMKIAEALNFTHPYIDLSVIHTEINARIECVALTAFDIEDGGRIPDDNGGPTLRLCRIIEELAART